MSGARTGYAARAALGLLLWGSLLLWPGRAAGDGLNRALGQVAGLIAAWQEEAAELTLAPLAAALPDDPRVLMLQGELRFRAGDYAGAVKTLERAKAAAPGQRAITELLALVRATRKATSGYQTYRSPGGNFVIAHAPGKDAILAPLAAEALEAARSALKQDLGYAPSRPVRVEIYPDHSALVAVSPLSKEDVERTGTVALCKYNRLMIVSPRALLRGYPWLDTLGHEYVHLVVSRVSHNSVPVWLHEGLAKHFEARWRTPPDAAPELSPAQEHLLAEALRRGSLLSWERMHPSMAKLPDQLTATLAFAQAQTAVGFLAQRGGAELLARLVRAFAGDSAGGWAPLAQVSGLNRKAFDAAWRKHLRALSPRPMPGLSPIPRRYGEQKSEELRLAELRQDRARDYLRLADLLRGRGRIRAAIIEYRKARQELGERDELSSNHLARAYLEAGEPAKAVTALRPVLEYYPELPGPQVTMGVAQLRAGDPKAAVKHFKVALRLNPFTPELHCALAEALGESGHGPRHLKLCRALSSTP